MAEWSKAPDSKSGLGCVQRGFDSHSLLEQQKEPDRVGGGGLARRSQSAARFEEPSWRVPRTELIQPERCPSGRRGTIGNRVYRKVPRVRIPLSPPDRLRPRQPGSSSSGVRRASSSWRRASRSRPSLRRRRSRYSRTAARTGRGRRTRVSRSPRRCSRRKRLSGISRRAQAVGQQVDQAEGDQHDRHPEPFRAHQPGAALERVHARHLLDQHHRRHEHEQERQHQPRDHEEEVADRAQQGCRQQAPRAAGAGGRTAAASSPRGWRRRPARDRPPRW